MQKCFCISFNIIEEMKKGIIFLARHGQNEDNAEKLLNGHRDRPLTDLGREQAVEVAKKLNGKGIQKIYSSPLVRSFETGEIIADVLGLDKPEVNTLFIERDFGVLTGKPVADILKYSSDDLQTEHVLHFLNVEGSEDYPKLKERGFRGLKFIQEKHPEDTVLIVSHGDIGKMIKAAFYDKDWKDVLQEGYFSHTTIHELK